MAGAPCVRTPEVRVEMGWVGLDGVFSTLSLMGVMPGAGGQ